MSSQLQNLTRATCLWQLVHAAAVEMAYTLSPSPANDRSVQFTTVSKVTTGMECSSFIFYCNMYVYEQVPDVSRDGVGRSIRREWPADRTARRPFSWPMRRRPCARRRCCRRHCAWSASASRSAAGRWWSSSSRPRCRWASVGSEAAAPTTIR